MNLYLINFEVINFKEVFNIRHIKKTADILYLHKMSAVLVLLENVIL